jgi:hypothetical protein
MLRAGFVGLTPQLPTRSTHKVTFRLVEGHPLAGLCYQNGIRQKAKPPKIAAFVLRA